MAKFFYTSIFILFVLLLSADVHAARLYFTSEKENLGVGGALNIRLRIDTEGEEINAADVLFEFSSDKLKLENINDGGSIINIWVEKPQETDGSCFTDIEECGKIKMSGVIPGGFLGDGLLANMTFRASGEGKAYALFDFNSKIFLNNVNADNANLSYSGLEINIDDGLVFDNEGDGIRDISEENILVLDFFPPESFSILIEKTPLSYDNKWFAVFNTQDKGSGVDHYEIKEKFLGFLGGKWKETDSPYILEDQRLLSLIIVKAIDGVGLTRESKLIPDRLIQFYILGAAILVIFIILFVTIFILRKIKSHKTYKTEKSFTEAP